MANSLVSGETLSSCKHIIRIQTVCRSYYDVAFRFLICTLEPVLSDQYFVSFSGLSGRWLLNAVQNWCEKPLLELYTSVLHCINLSHVLTELFTVLR